MIKKIVWALPVSIGGIALGATAIGLGYTGSITANPYAVFFKRPTYNTTGALVDAYQAATLHGAKVVVGAGFTHAVPFQAAAQQEFFKKRGSSFVLIDEAYNGATNPGGYRVASITFRISEAGFLTGIALGEYLNYYQEIFAPNEGDRLTYASWGGLPFGTVIGFMSGFQQGINYFNNVMVGKINQKNPNLKYKPIHQITTSKTFAGGFAPSDGAGPATQLFTGQTKTWSIYEQEPVVNGNTMQVWKNKNNFKKIAEKEIPDAVLVVAGPQVSTAIDTIQKEGCKSVIIGVDVAQENDRALNKPYSKPLTGGDKKITNPICFSMMKDIANTTDKVLNNITNGKSRPEETTNGFGGLGWNSKGDLKNGGVSISNAGKPFLYNALVRSGDITGDAVADPTGNFDESVLKDYYEKSVKFVQTQKDYIYNQGVNGEVAPADEQYICSIVAEDSGNGSSQPGYQFKNQFVAPFSADNEGKPTNLAKESYSFVDGILNVSNVHAGDEEIHKEFVAQVANNLQTDVKNANEGVDKGVDTLKNDIKVVLSESTSVLLDNSFSQSSFEGILRYLYNVSPTKLGFLYQEFRKNVLKLPALTSNTTYVKKEILK